MKVDYGNVIKIIENLLARVALGFRLIERRLRTRLSCLATSRALPELDRLTLTTNQLLNDIRTLNKTCAISSGWGC